MSLEQQVIALTEATEQLLEAVNTRKADLNTAETNASLSAQEAQFAANQAADLLEESYEPLTMAQNIAGEAAISAGEAATSASQALAVYGSAEALQTALQSAQNSTRLAENYAEAASSVVQQDLSGVTAAALHRSPNAITAMFVYDTSKDSDGGAWTEKCQHTSWYNEELCGKWLGAQPSEANARYEGSVLGDELVTNGTFDTDLSGWDFGAGWSWDSGAAKATNTSSALSQTIGSAGPAKTFRIAFTQTILSGGRLRVRIRNFANNLDLNFTYRSGSQSVVVYVNSPDGGITFSVVPETPEVLTIDDISVKEVIAQTTQPGDYFQLTTDGKFYQMRKNLLARSNEFTSPWIAVNGASITNTAISDPFGGITARELTGTSGSSYLQYAISPVGVVTLSLYAKAGTASTIGFGGTGIPALTFDLAAGTSGTSASFSSATITLIGDGWYRCTATFANGVSVSSIRIAGASGTVLIYGAQLEYGQVATSYEAKAAEGSISEVFRGNKRDFPRLAGIVAEAASVTIYDLTEKGDNGSCPMWMRFARAASVTGFVNSYTTSATISCAAQVNGVLAVGSNSGASGFVVNFPGDKAAVFNNNNHYTYSNTQVAARQTATSIVLFNAAGAYVLPNTTVNAVAMTVLPDAPVDPVTGLKVPTIWAATSGGVSRIAHNGTVSNSLPMGWPDGVIKLKIIGNYIARYGYGDGHYNYFEIQPTNIVSTTWGKLAPFNPFGNGTTTYGGVYLASGKNAYGTTTGVTLVKERPENTGKGIQAMVRNTYNTGHQPGDIRRTYLADNVVGSVSGPELVANGTFDTDTSGWTAGDGAILSVVSGKLSVVSGGSGAYSDARQELTTVPGRVYKLTADFIYVTSRGNIGVGTTAGGTELAYISPITGASSVSTLFVATSTTTHICFGTRDTTAGLEAQYDNISVKEVVGDRSYKAKGANITGTLTKSAVASNAQLVAYSGFSADNYLREPYSADIDFGTGEWSVSSWINIPVENAAAGTIVNRAFSSGPYITIGIDTTNRLIATAYDGTNTRVVSTDQQYNIATWIKIETCYTIDGKLSLRINGIETTSTSGTPLLTLNNTSAVLTIGNSYNLDAPFPGSLALLKLSATVPTAEQSIWMYEQEKQMFREGAQVCLPDSGSIVDLAYDDSTDTWIAASATNVSEWSGLVRTKVTPTPAGSYSKLSASSGVQLQARTTNNPGVDITIPSYNIKGELEKRSESAAKIKKLITFDYDSVSGQTEFVLPLGYTTKAVYVNGFAKWQGATKDYTLLYDGFKETVKFAVAPTAASWIQIHAEKES